LLDLGCPECGALAFGDVRLLGDAQAREGVGGFARTAVERALACAKAGEICFRTKDENGRGAKRDARQRTTGQSQHT
jgi:hypothetical protein